MNFLLLLTLVGIGGIVLVLVVRAHPIFFICLTGYSLVLTQSFPIAYIGERPVNISTDYILIPLLLAVWLLSRIQRAGRRALPRFALPYLFFSVWAVITLLLSIFRHGLTANLIAFVETTKWFLNTLLLLPCLEFIRTENHARTVLKHLAIAAFIVVIVGYVQWYFLPNRSSGNIVSTFGSISRLDIISTKNAFAVYVAMGWLVIVALFLNRSIKRHLGLLLLGAFGILVLWSFSRSAVLGMLVGLIWLFLTTTTSPFQYFRVPKRLGYLFTAVGILIIAAFAFSAKEGFEEHTPIGRMVSLFDNTNIDHGSESVEQRKSLFWDGTIALLERPLEGYGFYARGIEKPNLTIVDNFYMDVALDTGFVGLLLMLWLLMSTIGYVWRIKHVSLRLNTPELSAWSWGVGGALVCLYFSGISASIPYSGRILGTVAIGLACLAKWQKHVLMVRDRDNQKNIHVQVSCIIQDTSTTKNEIIS